MPVLLRCRRFAWSGLAPGLLTFTILASPVDAQPQTGTIGGVVTDAQGGTLPGTSIGLLVDIANGVRWSS